MSNLDTAPVLKECGGRAAVSAKPVRQLLSSRQVPLGESTVVRRLLPTLNRRMIGAWCFADHYGPDDITTEPGMRVPPHPHTGLQTVSWLLDGEILHRDSLGSEQTLRPGQLGLMTAGRAIAHAEQSPVQHPSLLHGAQLWVALPDAARFIAPKWEFHSDLPAYADSGISGTVILGELGGVASPGITHSPLVGADLSVTAGASVAVPLEPDFEYAVFVVEGTLDVDDAPLAPGQLLYLGCGRSSLSLRATGSGPGVGAGRLLLLGGEPFDEKIVMWWNFVARSGEEIAQWRSEWMVGEEFGTVLGYPGAALPAPPMPPTPLRARGRER
ncbi:MAG TPA: pirin family protein [Pseudonocardiaceae bacterium]